MKYGAVSISIYHSNIIPVFRHHNVIVKSIHMLLTQI